MGAGYPLLITSYVIDWVVLIAVAAVGAGFSYIGPRKRPFDITDRSISYPLNPDTVTNTVLVLSTLLAPAAIIFLGSLFNPFPSRFLTTDNPNGKSSSFRRKVWEWHTGWLGLALAYALAFTITNGAKEVLGKPRPNLLARCHPDISKRLVAAAGGIGDQIEEGITMFNTKICKSTGSVLSEGFRSFPSGHSSLAWAGLGYLALWLCAKFGVAIPSLTHQSYTMGLNFPNQAPTTAKGERKTDTLRRQAAAPPAYLIIFPLIPIAGAIYISSTRYSDFQHHGFDVLMSAILGSLTAWLGFRWYQMPIRRGGWAWAARSLERAFWRGLGADTYGQDRGLTVEDLEHARAAQGVADGAMLPQSVGHSGTQDHSDGSGGSYELRDLGGTMAQAPTDFTALGEDNGTRRVVRLA